MADGGYLIPPSQDPSKEEIWIETRKRLGRFLPDLFSEVFPDPPNDSEKSHSGTAVSSPIQTSEAEPKNEETSTPQDNAEKKETVANSETQATPQEVEEDVAA